MKESRRSHNLLKCAGQSYVRMGAHSGAGQLALSTALILLWGCWAPRCAQYAPHQSPADMSASAAPLGLDPLLIRIWKESILQLWTPVACLLLIIVFIMVALNGPNIQRYHRVQPWREADEEADPAYSNKMQKADVAMQKGFCVVSFSLPCLLVPRDVGDRVLVLLCSVIIRTYFQGSRNFKKFLPPLARARI